MDKKEYAWYFDKLDSSSEPYNTIDECLEEARQENDGTYEKVFIGVVEYIDSRIDINSLIEEINNNVYSDTEDEIEDYLDDVTDEEKKELSTELNKVFDKWKKKYSYNLNFFFVKDSKAYNL